MPNLSSHRFESVASRASHVTLQTVCVLGSLELDTLLNILLIICILIGTIVIEIVLFYSNEEMTSYYEYL